MDFNEIKSILSDKISFQIISMTVIFSLDKICTETLNVASILVLMLKHENLGQTFKSTEPVQCNKAL